MTVYFSKTARNQYEKWQAANPRIRAKIDSLLADIQQNGFLTGDGKPEQLKHYQRPQRYSRRITKSDRLVYAPYEDGFIVIACKGHYDE